MKFVLFMLIAGCISEIAHTLPAASGDRSRDRRGVKVIVDIAGEISCPTEFKARVNTWELDNRDHDAVGGVRAEELWPRDNEVELVTTIEHNCETGWACVCKDHEKQGGAEFTEHLRINDFKTTELKRCGMCDYTTTQKDGK